MEDGPPADGSLNGSRVPDRPVADLAALQDPGVDVALNLIVAMAAALIQSADGVSISVADRQRFTTVAASDQRVFSMDKDQYEVGEGPCLSAAMEERRFHSPEISEERRWPQFSARAHERGIGSVLSTPLLLGEVAAGSLNIYSLQPFAFGGEERAMASAFAVQASAVLKAEVQGDASGTAIGQGLQVALVERELEAFRRAVITWSSLTAGVDDGEQPSTRSEP